MSFDGFEIPCKPALGALLGGFDKDFHRPKLLVAYLDDFLCRQHIVEGSANFCGDLKPESLYRQLAQFGIVLGDGYFQCSFSWKFEELVKRQDAFKIRDEGGVLETATNTRRKSQFRVGICARGKDAAFRGGESGLQGAHLRILGSRLGYRFG